MNAKVMTVLTFLASRSRRFRRFVPLLSIVPIAMTIARAIKHRKAKRAIEPPRYEDRPGAYSLRSSPAPAPASFR
jgi:hypothetical protein